MNKAATDLIRYSIIILLAQKNILQTARIDTGKKYSKPPTILSLVDSVATSIIHKRVLTLGNFSCIIGKAKSKKTFFISLVTATFVRENQNWQADRGITPRKG